MLPTMDTAGTDHTHDIVEVACDESGFTGTNLLDPGSPVIAHASVDLTVGEAAEVLATLRSRFGHPRAAEHKAAALLRFGESRAVQWFRHETHSRSHVHVIDKRSYIASRVLELLVLTPSYGSGTQLSEVPGEAVAALRERPDVLAAFVAMTRLKHRRRADPAAVDRFLVVASDGAPGLGGVARAGVEGVLGRLLDGDPEVPPPLEPLVPAVAETALWWSARRRSVAVVHDEQSALTPQRMARLAAYLADAVAPGPPPLLGVRQVDSRQDPRVQVADLLAGLARRASTSGAVLHAQP